MVPQPPINQPKTLGSQVKADPEFKQQVNETTAATVQKQPDTALVNALAMPQNKVKWY